MEDNETPKGLLKWSFVLGKMDTITFNGDYLNREDRTGRWVRIYLKV
jgi:hypothetical protein